MAKLLDTIIEEREELMVSLTGDAIPTLRTAHFLKPSFTGRVSELPSIPFSSKPTTSELKKWHSNVKFKGRRNPQKNWKEWVDHLHSMHQSTWRKANIYEAVMSSTYHIKRHDDIVLGVAEKWSSQTNTFIFPWGEATISLEDMMVLGGYSLMGDSILSPLESTDMVEMNEKLIEAQKKIASTVHGYVSHYAWMGHFMCSGLELEHEAFLALWLSRYVFPSIYDRIGRHVFCIAVHLARGTPIALAPAILANICKDLGLLKEKMVASNTLETGFSKDGHSTLNLWSPFQLVQLWVWERIPTLSPKPNKMKYGEPRSARWHRLKRVEVKNVRMAIDCAAECFQWRPYAVLVSNWSFPNFYREREEWLVVNSDLDKDLESFARCLRISELVGLDCIEQYLPHRIAMQFGLDQDIPDCVHGSNATTVNAWSDYNRPVGDAKLYIPPRLFESDVTTRYLKWWNPSFLGWQNSVECVTPKSLRSLPELETVMEAFHDLPQMVGPSSSALNQNINVLLVSAKEYNAMDVPPGFPPKGISVDGGENSLVWKDRIVGVVRQGGSSLSLPRDSKRNKKAEGSVNGDKLLMDNNVGKTLVSNAKHYFGTQWRIPYCSGSGEMGREEKSPVKQTIMPSKDLVGGPEETMENTNEKVEKSPVNDTVSTYENDLKCSSYDTDVPGLELEARISKLENMVSVLKAKQGLQV